MKKKLYQSPAQEVYEFFAEDTIMKTSEVEWHPGEEGELDTRKKEGPQGPAWSREENKKFWQ
ncbi:MAG: hypothetical protein IKB97_02005 [Bacteroidaceae bacterium]|nr:hypothetical protein [Bacteroidaceae bacterium]